MMSLVMFVFHSPILFVSRANGEKYLQKTLDNP